VRAAGRLRRSPGHANDRCREAAADIGPMFAGQLDIVHGENKTVNGRWRALAVNENHCVRGQFGRYEGCLRRVSTTHQHAQ
jgi:hypothetical protein